MIEKIQTYIKLFMQSILTCYLHSCISKLPFAQNANQITAKIGKYICITFAKEDKSRSFRQEKTRFDNFKCYTIVDCYFISFLLHFSQSILTKNQFKDNRPKVMKTVFNTFLEPKHIQVTLKYFSYFSLTRNLKNFNDFHVHFFQKKSTLDFQ